MRADSQTSVASEARATAIYENKESNNYPDLTSRIAHFRFVSQYLFHEAPEVMLPEVINMIEERRSAERATKPRKHTPLFKTERLMEMKFPSSSEDNPTIKHVWQTDAETRNERAERRHTLPNPVPPCSIASPWTPALHTHAPNLKISFALLDQATT